jgi:hypothetical protein
MLSRNLLSRKFSLLPLLALLLAADGCVLLARPTSPSFTVTAGYDYAPPRYQGYVVYYDSGVPFYVIDGRRYYVPRDSRYYDRYVRHYRMYYQSPAYREWRHQHYPTRVERGPRPDVPTRGPRYRDPQLHHRPR